MVFPRSNAAAQIAGERCFGTVQCTSPNAAGAPGSCDAARYNRSLLRFAFKRSFS